MHIAEWVRLTAEKAALSPHDAAKLGRPEEAISKAAKELGISKDTAARAVKAESLPDEAKALADEFGLGTVALLRPSPSGWRKSTASWSIWTRPTGACGRLPKTSTAAN